MTSDSEEKVRARAHQIWEREGRPDGRHEEHWAQARHEIENETAAAGDASAGLEVTPYNDPSRSGGPVHGGPYPAGAGGVASGLQPGGTRPDGGAAGRTEGAMGAAAGGSAGGTGSKADRRR